MLFHCSSIENGAEQWNNCSNIMHTALKDAAVQAKEIGQMTAEESQTYIRSGTKAM